MTKQNSSAPIKRNVAKEILEDDHSGWSDRALKHLYPTDPNANVPIEVVTIARMRAHFFANNRPMPEIRKNVGLRMQGNRICGSEGPLDIAAMNATHRAGPAHNKRNTPIIIIPVGFLFSIFYLFFL